MDVRHDAEEMDPRLSDLVATVRNTIRRRWLTLLAVAAVVFALGVAFVLHMTPMYNATARLRIDPSRNPLASNTNQPSQTEPSSEAIETEATAMNSPDLARSVVRQLGLANNPEFAASLGRQATAGTMTSAGRETALANVLLDRLSVAREKLTYILDVGYTSSNPATAAAIANAVAKTYIESRVEDKAGTAQRQSQWFERRLNELSNEVRAADAQVAEFRAKAGIVQSDTAGAQGGTIIDQQVAPLAGTLATAESDAAAARANLAAAQAQVHRGGLDAVSEVLSSPVIGDLRGKRAEVLRDRDLIRARYGPKHPESIRVDDQLASLDAQIQAEARRVVGSVQAAASAAEARASSLQGSLKQLQTDRENNARNSVLADSMEREAAAKRALYDRMSQMSLASMQAARVSMGQAALIDLAEAPARPTSPNKPLLLALCLIVAFAAGGGTIAAQEMMAGGMRSAEDVEGELGVPMLAAVPKVKGGGNPADILLDRPTSYYAESLRIARAALLGVRGTAAPKVIAITSAIPSEGKTTTALAFARTLAIANARTLLIECDVRRAAMRRMVKTQPARAGLVEVLHGTATAAEAITSGDVPNLDQLLVLAPYYSSEDLFGGNAMQQLLGDLRDKYTHVVLDLPPIVGLADGRYLSVLADATVLVVKWDATPVSAVQSAMTLLRGDGSNVVGAIYSMVESSAEVVGGLYYAKQYSDYYKPE